MRKEGVMFADMVIGAVLAIVVLVILLGVAAWRPL